MNNDEVMEFAETAGFEVVGECEIGDLSDVKQEKILIPPTKAAKLEIKKASIKLNADETYRRINVALALVDGITDAEGNTKYKGKTVFVSPCYYADPNKYTKDWFKKRQHLVELKNFLKAVDIDISNVKVNDELLNELRGKIVVGDVEQVANNYTAKDGTKVEDTVNVVKYIRAVTPDSL